MITDEQVSRVVDELISAATTRKPVQRLTARFPEMTVEDSYRVQNLWRERCEAQGRTLVGRKIGLTSRAMQMSSGITEPDYGVIFSDMVFESGSILQTRSYTFPRVEMELAFVLKDDIIGPNASIFDVLRATEYVVPALEILDSRIELTNRTIVDTISDNAAMGVMVIGGTPMAPTEVDLRWISGILYKNQQIEETGVAAGVLGHPANGVHWLANRIAKHGDELKAGQIVLAGSFTRPMPVSKGDTVFADYGQMGTVTCQFA
jgi:2-oxo-hept-3-ene-1,7-dioate hydratase